jgi:multidrug resistance protein, MATE family
MSPPLTRREVLERSWPIILANATVPLLSLVDTAVIGNTGTATDLGAVALGGLVFNFIHLGLNFLRMSTTGFVSQASGAGDARELRAVFARGMCVAAAFGCLFVLLKVPVASAALSLLHGSSAVEASAGAYVSVRLWAAPAGLCTHVVRGVLIGLARSHALLWLEGSINALNLALNLVFVAGLRWGATGVALGTAIAEWIGLALALFLARAALREQPLREPWSWQWQHVFDAAKLKVLFQANADILVRTLLLLFGFAWFTDHSARFGDAVLAANHVLLQFLSFCAFFLDGYANVAESMVGTAIGAGQRRAFDQAVRRASELAGGTAGLLALLLWGTGPLIIRALTDLPAVQAAALEQLPLAALYIGVSVAAFQLDGIFIGATRTRDMRNASIASCAIFVIAAELLTPPLGNHGLWLAFIVFVIARALTLGAYYPGLRRSIPDQS